jgi:hypothetical protein
VAFGAAVSHREARGIGQETTSALALQIVVTKEIIAQLGCWTNVFETELFGHVTTSGRRRKDPMLAEKHQLRGRTGVFPHDNALHLRV